VCVQLQTGLWVQDRVKLKGNLIYLSRVKCVGVSVFMSACVRVCVCVRERE